MRSIFLQDIGVHFRKFKFVLMKPTLSFLFLILVALDIFVLLKNLPHRIFYITFFSINLLFVSIIALYLYFKQALDDTLNKPAVKFIKFYIFELTQLLLMSLIILAKINGYDQTFSYLTIYGKILINLTFSRTSSFTQVEIILAITLLAIMSFILSFFLLIDQQDLIDIIYFEVVKLLFYAVLYLRYSFSFYDARKHQILKINYDFLLDLYLTTLRSQSTGYFVFSKEKQNLKDVFEYEFGNYNPYTTGGNNNDIIVRKSQKNPSVTYKRSFFESSNTRNEEAKKFDNSVSDANLISQQNKRNEITFKNNAFSKFGRAEDNQSSYFRKHNNSIELKLLDKVQNSQKYDHKILKYFEEKHPVSLKTFIQFIIDDHLTSEDHVYGPFLTDIFHENKQPVYISVAIKRFYFMDKTVFYLSQIKEVSLPINDGPLLERNSTISKKHCNCEDVHNHSQLTIKENNEFCMSNLSHIKISNKVSFSPNASLVKICDNCVKISALLHDFKNVVYDYTSNFSLVLNKLPLDLKSQFLEDLELFNCLGSYIISLIKFMTDFLKTGEFFSNHKKGKGVDLIRIINLMCLVFNKRLQFDNEIKGIGKQKHIKIYSKVHNIDPAILEKFSNTYSSDDLFISLFYNLISNSYKHTDKGTITFDIMIEPNYVVVVLSDTGKGIPDHILSNWGKAFNNHGFGDTGSGLGQLIIEKICTVLGVRIPKPETRLGQGTVFKLYFPIEEKPSQASIMSFNTKIKVSHKSLNNVLSTEIRTFNLIILDDSCQNVSYVENYIKSSLSSMKYTNVCIHKTFKFSETLIELSKLLIQNQFFDFILLDFNIEEKLNGIDAARIIFDIYSRNNLFNEKTTHFFFLTEQDDVFASYHKKYPYLVLQDRVISRSHMDTLIMKIKEIVRDGRTI